MPLAGIAGAMPRKRKRAPAFIMRGARFSHCP